MERWLLNATTPATAVLNAVIFELIWKFCSKSFVLDQLNLQSGEVILGHSFKSQIITKLGLEGCRILLE